MLWLILIRADLRKYVYGALVCSLNCLQILIHIALDSLINTILFWVSFLCRVQVVLRQTSFGYPWQIPRKPNVLFVSSIPINEVIIDKFYLLRLWHGNYICSFGACILCLQYVQSAGSASRSNKQLKQYTCSSSILYYYYMFNI